MLGMTVDELGARMTSEEFVDWIAEMKIRHMEYEQMKHQSRHSR